MSVKMSTDPTADAQPGDVVGRPVRIPYIMLCTQGERFCGWVRVANNWRELPGRLAERRAHEMGCRGGLIVAGR